MEYKNKLIHEAKIQLGNRGSTYIMVYDKNQKYIGTVYLDDWGMELKTGRSGRKPLAEFSWQDLFRKVIKERV